LIEIAIAALLAAMASDAQDRARPLIKQAYRVPPGTVFHVRVLEPDAPHIEHLTFTPRIPSGIVKNQEKIAWYKKFYPSTKKPGAPADENATCPRVCFSHSLAGAMASINLGMATLDQGGCGVPKRVDIYVNRLEVNMGVPTEEAVYDAEGTGELWALEPIALELLRSIGPDQTEQIATAEDYAIEHYEESESVVEGPEPRDEDIRRMAVIAILEELGIP